MRFGPPALGVLLLLSGVGPVASDQLDGPLDTSSAGENQAWLPAAVTRAVDGSGLDARVAGNRTAVRYLGARAPGLNQPCGREALDRNAELARDGVLLESDTGFEFDQNGLRLYYAYTPAGVSIDETLIAEGLASAAHLDAARGEYLAGVEAEARASGRGCLWSAG